MFLAILLVALNTTAPASAAERNCFKNPEANSESSTESKSADGKTNTLEVITTLTCLIPKTQPDSLEKIHRFFSTDMLERLNSYEGPFTDAMPVFGNKLMQDHPTSVAYEIKPTGKDRDGIQAELFGDGRIHLSRDRVGAADRVSIGFVMSQIRCLAGGGNGRPCLTKIINGRTDYVQEGGAIRVTSVSLIRVENSPAILVRWIGRGKAVEMTQKSLNDMVKLQVLPPQK